jgi:hypothetical protein
MRDLRIVEADSDLRGLVRELADASTRDGEQLLSMYVNLDPSEFAMASSRSSGITSAIDEAERTAPDPRWIELLEELRERFDASDYSIDGASGMLIYSRADGDPVLVKLPRPVEPEVAWDRKVHIRQLVEALPTETWCVLLCNRRSARILIGDRDQLEQVEAFRDEVDGQHDQGGWSQKRYARNIQEQVDDHLRHAARVVFEKHREGLFDRLLVAAPAELRGELEGRLHDSVHRVLEGWLDIDVEHASAGDVCRAAGRAIARRDQRRIGDVVARLRQNAGRGERAALGLDDVLAALREQRVDTLVVNGGYGEPGHVCPHGDWLATEGGTCPLHGASLQPCADIVDAAIECAVRQGAHVITVDRGDPLQQPNEDGTLRDREEFLGVQSLGSIAAVVRFDLTEGPRGAGALGDFEMT